MGATRTALVSDALGRPLGVGRATRVVPPRLRRALRRRDGGCCRYPGCQTTFTDAHHVVHWADGGPTDAVNLVSLCRHHHTRLHRGAFAIAADGRGGFAFTDPEGLPIPACRSMPPAAAHAVGAANALHGVVTSRTSPIPDWDGGHQDISAAIEVLYDATYPAHPAPDRSASAEAPPGADPDDRMADAMAS